MLAIRSLSAQSDRCISGGSLRRRPKMAGMRRAHKKTSASEPHSDLQGEGRCGRNQGGEVRSSSSTAFAPDL